MVLHAFRQGPELDQLYKEWEQSHECPRDLKAWSHREECLEKEEPVVVDQLHQTGAEYIEDRVSKKRKVEESQGESVR